MAYRNLDEYLIRLEQSDQLRIIEQPVHTLVEINQLTQCHAAEGKALWFDAVANTQFPVITNLFATEQQIAWAFGVSSLNEVEGKLKHLLDPDLSAGPTAMMGRATEVVSVLRSAGLFGMNNRQRNNDYIPLDDIDSLATLLKTDAEDCQFSLSGQLVYTHPHTAQQCTGTVQLMAGNSKLMLHADDLPLNADTTPVAIVIGGDPAAMWAVNMPMPSRINPYWMAGWLRRKPVPMISAQTLNVLLPANAEIVIEGCIHNAYHGDLYDFEITKAYRRDGAVIPLLQTDAFWAKKAEERLFLPIARTFIQDLVDLNITHTAQARSIAVAQVSNNRQVHQIVHGLLGTSQLAQTDMIICVDRNTNLHDPHNVAQAVTDHIRWSADLIVIHQGDRLKLGLDATQHTTGRQLTADDTLTRPHRIWGDDLLITSVAQGEDIHPIIQSLWEKKPDLHLLLVPASIQLDDIYNLFYEVIFQQQWQMTYQYNGIRRVAINATST